MAYVYPTHLNKHISLSLWDVLNMIWKMYGYNTYEHACRKIIARINKEVTHVRVKDVNYSYIIENTQWVKSIQ